MRVNRFIPFALALLAGCSLDNSHFYTVGESPGRPPLWYPLDYPVCHPSDDGGTIYVPLAVRIWSAGLPSPARVAAVLKKNTSADICSSIQRILGPVKERIILADSESGASVLDIEGSGFAASSFEQTVMTLKQVQQEEDKKKAYEERAISMYGKDRYYPDVMAIDEKLEINGATWHHIINNKFRSGGEKAIFSSTNEMYERVIDHGHVYRVIGRFTNELQVEKELYESRRKILRELVDSVRIKALSPREVDAALAQYERNRALDWKCSVNRKCRDAGVSDADMAEYRREQERIERCKTAPSPKQCMRMHE